MTAIPSRSAVASRFLVAVVLGVIGLAVVPTIARAGTYEVVACDAAPQGQQRSWVGVHSQGMSTGTNCPTNRVDERGIWAAAAVNVGTVPAFSAARSVFEAPPGTSIVFLSSEYMFRRVDTYWGVGLWADGNHLHGCLPNQGGSCNFTTGLAGSPATFSFAKGVHQVYTQAACGNATGCSTSLVGPPFFERAGLRIYSATVRVQDGSAPALWDVHDGRLSNGAWQRGPSHIGYAASDNVGIRRTRFYIDGHVREDVERSCDYTLRVPCSDLTYRGSHVDTRALTDRTHSYQVEVVDTAGNPQSLSSTFRVDNTAPNEPTGVSVQGGEDWRQSNDFDVSWTNPGSASQITSVHYELCNTATAACTTAVRSAPGISSLSDLTVPEPGDYTLRMWLGDEAGNINSANRSEAVHLRFDNVPPGQAQLTTRNGWINAVEAASFDQRIELARNAIRPVSGVKGYSVTTDGTDPDATVDVVGDVYRITDLREGITTVRARAVSGSGVPSGELGETTIRVDKTRPETSVIGAPVPDRWQRGSVGLELRGTDQAGLSGMDPAPDPQPLDSGAYLEYTIDGGLRQQIRGGSTSTRVTADGEHTLTLRAVDAAGNVSADRVVRFMIDATAPELVVFEAQEPHNPRRVAVAAADRVSGVAGAAIAMRRLMEGGAPGSWEELETRRDGDHFVAQVDDERLAPGRYELRARVVDLAGNEAFGTLRRDGQPAVVDTATLRVDTRLNAALVKRTVPRRRRCPRRRPRCNRTPRPARVELVSTLSVPFGKRATARGTLMSASGAPIAGAAVDVFAKPNSTGAEYVRVGVVRTTGAGAFSYEAPAGTSRTLRFRYEGSQQQRPSEGEVTVRVPAATTIKVDRRRARNRQKVTFSGRLRGLPIPTGGKLVDLQAFYRGRWRTFATPRANGKGAWRFKYRFGATRRPTTYRFRAVIRREAVYPYEEGLSALVSVRVVP